MLIWRLGGDSIRECDQGRPTELKYGEKQRKRVPGRGIVKVAYARFRR